EATDRGGGAVGGGAAGAPRGVRGVPAVIDEPIPETLPERPRPGEVRVVAALLAGQRDMDGVMEVVRPLPVERVPAALRTAAEPWIVQIALGDDERLPAGARALGVHGLGALREAAAAGRSPPRP